MPDGIKYYCVAINLTYLLARKIHIGRFMRNKIHCPHKSKSNCIVSCSHIFGIFH